MPTDKRARQREGRQLRHQEMMRAQRQWRRRRRLRLLVPLVVLVAAAAAFLLRDDDESTEVATDATTTTSATADEEQATGTLPCPPAEGAPERVATFDGPPPMCIDRARDYRATVSTTKGEFTMDLLENEAPQTVNNFVYLSRYQFYDGITFHRIIPDFVVQGGDPEGTGSGGPGYEFGDELPDPSAYREGSVAMANSGPNTNGSQFFIVTSAQGAETLVQAVGGEARYSLFGQVTDGMDVVKALEAVGTPGQGTPTEEVKILDVVITEQ